MAFELKNLSVLAYANAFTLWHYTTSDSAKQVSAAGYFNDASTMLRVGDMILANVDTDSANAKANIFLINYNESVVVNVANLTSIGAVDDAS